MGRHLVSGWWLLAVPTMCAIAPRYIYPQDTEGVVLETCIPMVGFLAAVGYAATQRQLGALWALLPYAAVATAFLVGGIIVAATFDHPGDLETTNWFGNVVFVLVVAYFIQPWLAAIGGGPCTYVFGLADTTAGARTR